MAVVCFCIMGKINQYFQLNHRMHYGKALTSSAQAENRVLSSRYCSSGLSALVGEKEMRAL